MNLAFRAPSLLIAGYLLLATAFVFSNPPGAAPDETAHYLKAMAAGRGDLILDTDPPPLKRAGNTRIDMALRWLHSQERIVSIPARLSVEPFSCWGAPAYVGTCEKRAPESDKPKEFPTYVGRYPPYSYLVPGVLMRFASDSNAAMRLGRVGVAVTSMALIGTAILAIWKPKSPVSLMGLVAATTPMVLFLSATLSSSGVETAAGICFFACLLRISRIDDTPQWIWWATAISGATLAVVRDLGPLWLLLDGLIFIGLIGWKNLRSLLQQRAARFALVVLGVSTILALIWRLTQSVNPPLDPSTWLPHFKAAFPVLPEFLRQAIGVFGPLDAPLPLKVYWIWDAVLLLLLGIAFLLGAARHRMVLFMSTLTLVGVALLLDAVQQTVGFGVQARHFLPFAVAIPLLAGEIIVQRTSKVRFSPNFLALFIGAGAATVHLISWYTLSRRFAVGLHGPPAFFERAAWYPPGGWFLWAALAVSAAGLLLLSGWLSFKRS